VFNVVLAGLSDKRATEASPSSAATESREAGIGQALMQDPTNRRLKAELIRPYLQKAIAPVVAQLVNPSASYEHTQCCMPVHLQETLPDLATSVADMFPMFDLEADTHSAMVAEVAGKLSLDSWAAMKRACGRCQSTMARADSFLDALLDNRAALTADAIDVRFLGGFLGPNLGVGLRSSCASGAAPGMGRDTDVHLVQLARAPSRTYRERI